MIPIHAPTQNLVGEGEGFFQCHCCCVRAPGYLLCTSQQKITLLDGVMELWQLLQWKLKIGEEEEFAVQATITMPFRLSLKLL